MKRKFRIFSAIASLCMAVTLMAFGVYAAGSVTYKLSGDITYVNNDVYATVAVAGYSSTGGVVEYTATSVAAIAASGWSTTVISNAPASVSFGKGSKGTTKTANYPVSFTLNSAVKFVFTITSAQSTSFTAAIAVTPATNTVAAVATPSVTVAGRGTSTLTAYFGLANASTNIQAGNTYTVTITLTNAA